MQKLFLMQGVPGSGKSTQAQQIQAVHPGSVICSTDDFHYSEGGCFQPLNLNYFHSYNQWQAHLYLQEGKTVIVDNTNITRASARPYLEMARALGVEVVVVRCEGQWPNIHKVLQALVESMRSRLEKLV